MWLSGLHIPATYLAAVVQTTCRAKKWALDKSTLMTKVTKKQIWTHHITIRIGFYRAVSDSFVQHRRRSRYQYERPTETRSLPESALPGALTARLCSSCVAQRRLNARRKMMPGVTP